MADERDVGCKLLNQKRGKISKRKEGHSDYLVDVRLLGYASMTWPRFVDG
jgi:hypothetical protein